MGVLVSGLLDDGAAGLWEIAQHGGITVVQDPDEAPYPSMPLSALQDSAVDYQLTAPEIGNLIVGMASGKLEPRLQARRPGDAGEDQFSGFTCPECRGPLYTTRRPGPIEFHCRVGHILSFQTLVDEGTSTQERKLYEAIVALQEGADLAAFAADRADGVVKEKLRKESAQLRDDAEVIRQMIENRLMPSLL
jgi:two-component system chemotaxis response regulator CheB